MCGIAGIFYKDAQEHDVGDALIQMLYGSQHRGQESTRFAVYGHVYMCFYRRRLSHAVYPILHAKYIGNSIDGVR